MRKFHCDNCNTIVPFSAAVCPTCDASLGYVPDNRSIRVLTPTDDPVVYEIDGGDHRLWRCLNFAWGCNWMLPVDSPTGWCRSCRMTRGRPDDARPNAIAAWMSAEADKRHLIHQLDVLGLPIEFRSPESPDGLVFDFVSLPDVGGITGHLDGVVTLDLAEIDEAHRNELRRLLNEPFRTVLGHLRHEVGHHYFRTLVVERDDLDAFRRCFGDERVDYAAAVEQHYATGTGAWDPNEFISAYAASHPFEDWAETFGHYLHMIDVTDTAAAHHLIDQPTLPLAFPDLLAVWRPLITAVNAIAESLGASEVYPFEPADGVVDKLAFVHDRITAQVAPSAGAGSRLETVAPRSGS